VRRISDSGDWVLSRVIFVVDTRHKHSLLSVVISNNFLGHGGTLNRSIFFFLVLFFAPKTFATEVRTFKITVHAKFSYIKQEGCEDLLGANPLKLEMELDEGKILKAHFISPAYPYQIPGPEFTPEEIAGVQLYTDPFHRLWVKSIALTQRQLFWWVTEANWGYVFGERELATVAEPVVAAHFMTSGLGEEVLFSYSNCGKVSGTTKAGFPYFLNFEFVQRANQ
jgi:hypothetical protein